MRLVIVSAFAVVLASPVAAADLNVAPVNKAPAYGPTNQPAFTWAGNYFGVNLGGAGGNLSSDPLAAPALGGAAPTPFSDPSSVNSSVSSADFRLGEIGNLGVGCLGLSIKCSSAT